MRATHSVLLSALLATSALALPAVMPVSAMAATPEEASGYVTKVGDDALKILNGKTSAADIKTQLEALFTREVDVDWVSKFVMGRSWKELSAEQQAKYQETYKRFLIEHYTSNFTQYTQGTSFKVTRTTPQQRGEQQVASEILRPGQQPIIAEYRVRGEGANLKIVDVIIEGVSLITTQRQEFASVMQRHGFDYLLQQLQARTEAEKQKAATGEPAASAQK